MCMCTHVRTPVQANVEARDWWWDVFFNHLSPLLSWDRVSHSNLSLQLQCLARELPLGLSFLHPSTGTIGVHPVASFLHGCWRSELWTSCFLIKAFTEREPSPQSYHGEFLCQSLIVFIWNNTKVTQTGLWRWVQQLLNGLVPG